MSSINAAAATVELPRPRPQIEICSTTSDFCLRHPNTERNISQIWGLNSRRGLSSTFGPPNFQLLPSLNLQLETLPPAEKRELETANRKQTRSE